MLHPDFLRAELTQEQIDDWIAADMNEPMLATVLEYVRWSCSRSGITPRALIETFPSAQVQPMEAMYSMAVAMVEAFGGTIDDNVKELMEQGRHQAKARDEGNNGKTA